MRRAVDGESGFVIGAHLSIASGRARGFSRAVDEAETLGANALQIFTRSPSAWRARSIAAAEAAAFRTCASASGLRFLAVHAIYLLNLATPDAALYERSVAALIEEMVRAEALGAVCVVTHLGAHRGAGAKEGAARAVAAIGRALEATRRVGLLLENSAGSGTTLGGRFGEIAEIVDRVADERVGVCFDTCHAFASGYDLRTARAVDSTLQRFDRIIGLASLRLVHLNDSAYGLGSHRDRHEHLGRGAIGSGLAALVRHSALAGVPFILETPKTLDGHRDADAVSLRWARNARRGEEGS
ncbi:MAG: deoxyribonuclease IV [Candidatus Bipolaricaulota bacterium]|nr:deoxyribonuclease IV [Candidatus Bipolaricaulota bacterium]